LKRARISRGDAKNQPVISAASFNDGPAIARLLQEAKLPVPDDGDRPVFFFVARAPDGEVVGCAGCEPGDGALPLLRSVTVASTQRGGGLGQRLVRELADHLVGEGCEEIYLLTLDAQSFFARLGFAILDRELVPETVRASREFSIHACDDASAMIAALPLD
jgi:N-acetylglutamate synthase-like GNAT family acetyltransferase